MSVDGIDLSHWEVILDYLLLKNSGKKFAYLKATEGNYFVDDTYLPYTTALTNIGIYTGGYHYYRPHISGVVQANLFYSIAKGSRLPPSLDLEGWYKADDTYYRTHPRKEIWANIHGFLGRVEDLFQRIPLIYTGYYFWRDMIGIPPWALRYPLWIANYGVSQPSIPKPWTKPFMWQRSRLGVVPGIKGDVDLNLFYGTEEELRILAQDLPPVEPPAEGEEELKKCRCIVDTLKIRSLPSTNSTVVGYLHENDEPEVLTSLVMENGDIWYKLGWKQWAAKKYNSNNYLEDIV